MEMWGDGSATKSLAVLAEDLSSVPNTLLASTGTTLICVHTSI